MNQQQLLLTQLLGSKELTFGCLLESKSKIPLRYWSGRLAGVIPNGGGCGLSYRDEHGSRWDKKDFVIIGHPATLSDFHKWLNENLRQTKDDIVQELMWHQGKTQIEFWDDIPTLPYDSSKDLLEQSTETLAQIIELITNNS